MIEDTNEIREWAVLTLEELNERMDDLDENGIRVESECEKCGDPTEMRILPGESTDGAICRPCLAYIVDTTE